MVPIARIAVRKWTAMTLLVVFASAAALVFATPSQGISQMVLALARYEGIDADARRLPEWKAKLKVTGFSDIAVNSNTAAPGATSGWHSHPGLSIVSVTQGALWVYDAEDPTCTPTIVTAGNGFVEPGDHVHIARNEGTVEARWVTTAIRPAGVPGRIDQPAPGNCPF